MSRYQLICLFLLLNITIEGRSQERTISGRVTSVDDGLAIPGVNIRIKGTAKGTVTDIDGNYTLAISADEGTLVFSFIGLSSEEIEVGAQSVIDVQMVTGMLQLAEVVVTGVAGETDVRKLPFSVGKLNEDLIKKVPAVSAGGALQGKIAGVTVIQPSGSPGGRP